MSDRVSVIMPFLDPRPEHFEEAIASLFAQTYENWELILIDDGSGEPASQLAERHASADPDRIRLVSSGPRRPAGISAARNVGFLAANGELVAMLDSDDLYLPERLSRHVDALDAVPQAAMAFSDTLHWYGWGDPPEKGDEHRSAGVAAGVVDPPLLLTRVLRGRGEGPATCSMTVRRSAIAAVGGFEREWIGLCDNHVFSTKLLSRFPAVYLPGVCSKYRRHPDSLCRSTPHEAEVEIRRVFVGWAEQYAARELPENIRAEILEACRHAAWQLDHPWAGNVIRLFWKVCRRAQALRQ